MRFSVASLVAVATASLALAQPTRRAKFLLNPPPAVLEGFSGWDDAPAPAPAPLTNAKRFALNLPPLPPKTRRRPHSNARQLGTRVQSAPRAESSPTPPESAKCNILVSYTNGTPLGFLSGNWNKYGEYGQFSQSTVGALEVSFSYSPDSPSQINLVAANSNSASYPFVGATVGFSSTDDDLSPGSYNYAVIGGTQQSPSGSGPTDGMSSYSFVTNDIEKYESAIWSYSPATQAITAQWINTSGSSYGTSIVYIAADDGVLALTGDAPVFIDTLGEGDEVHFSCVPVSSAPTAS